jgi:probable xanthine dehydrogenase accessory factor
MVINMDKDIMKFVSDEVENGYKVAFTILTGVAGSSPGKMGAMMAISESGKTIGTVGGGNLENQITIASKKAIEDEKDVDFDYNLGTGGGLGMMCGGNVKGYTKIFLPQNKLIIVGAGHVGKALYEVASTLDLNITVVDDRAEYANVDNFPNANIITGKYEEILDDIKSDVNTAIVIVTRGHAYDKVAVEKLINSDYFYIGMIGSKNKVLKTLTQIKEDDRYKDNIEKLYAPIGIDIGSNKVKEIALGILCEIFLVKNNKKPQFMRDIFNEKIKNNQK